MTTYGCTVPGCQAAGWISENTKHRLKHLATVHIECACGWIGVNWNVHVAQRARRGLDIGNCRRVRSIKADDAAS